MRQLVIEYLLEGRHRGYNFTSPTRGFDEGTLKRIWRTAMPRGQGWSAEQYTGATSLKCFPLDDQTVALSHVTITDMCDEQGRRGIRRAVIDVMSADEGIEHIRHRLASFPDEIQAQFEKKPTLRQWKAILDRAAPKVKGSNQIILVHPYTGGETWQTMEALVLKLAISCLAALRHWGKIIPFTTMALDYRDESRIVALPAQQAQHIQDIPVIHIT